MKKIKLCIISFIFIVTFSCSSEKSGNKKDKPSESKELHFYDIENIATRSEVINNPTKFLDSCFSKSNSPVEFSRDLYYAEFSSNGNLLLTVSGNEAQIWNMKTGKLNCKSLVHQDSIYPGDKLPLYGNKANFRTRYSLDNKYWMEKIYKTDSVIVKNRSNHKKINKPILFKILL